MNISRKAEEQNLKKTLDIIYKNIENFGYHVSSMKEEIDHMMEHFHDDNPELINTLENTLTMHEHMKRALERNERAKNKPYFGRIIFHDETLDKEESFYIGRGGIAEDATNLAVIDWRAPVANAYYENGLGQCSYTSPDGKPIHIELKLKRTFEIQDGKLQNYFDTEVISNDELLTKYLSKNKQSVLNEIVATIQREQNDIIRKNPFHNIIVQGVAGSGKTTVAMHRISYILYNYAEKFHPEDFYIVGSNRILLNYITGVLPDLDVYGVRQMTMEQLFIRLLYEDWDDKKYQIQVTVVNKQSMIKGTLSWFHDLEHYCNELEWNTIPRDSIYLNRKQFVEGFQDGKCGVYDRTEGKPFEQRDVSLLVDGRAVEHYILQNPNSSLQTKINTLNERLKVKIQDLFLTKGVTYTEAEKKAILKFYHKKYGNSVWKKSIFSMYEDFLNIQKLKGHDIDIPKNIYDVYDLAALAYLYKRVKETDGISEAHHVVIDEAQDFGMMAYSVLKYCIQDCTYTIMGDVSQNIHFGFGLNDWEELKKLFLQTDRASFNVLKKSYRNTIEISEFAAKILKHGNFAVYPAEPIIRHGEPVEVIQVSAAEKIQKIVETCKSWQQEGLSTIAVICRDNASANTTAKVLGTYMKVTDSNLETSEFGNGIMVLSVAYTKGLEFDAVIILDPTIENYPVDDGHAKLLYVAATRALHKLCVLHTGNPTGLIANPITNQHLQVFDEKPSQDTSLKTSYTSYSKPTVNIKKPILHAKPILNAKPTRSLKPAALKNNTGTSFCDIPATELLRPMGHAKIDLSIIWARKEDDALYLQSRYGILRICPIRSDIIRITFAKDRALSKRVHSGISTTEGYQQWKFRDTPKTIELWTKDIILQMDKTTGAMSYLDHNKNVLLKEKDTECRMIEKASNGNTCGRLYFNWQKGETICAHRIGNKFSTNLRGVTRYISHGEYLDNMPFLVSDRGYGMVFATDTPTYLCDIPTYGSYVCTDKSEQLDYYFIVGNNSDSILDAFQWLRSF